MWRLVLWINLRWLRLKSGRTAITLTGIALGVAMVVAVLAANRSILAAYQRALGNQAGRAEIQVAGPGDGGMDLGLLDLVRAIPGVRDAVPVVKGRGLVQAGAAISPALIYAVQWEADRRVREYTVTAGHLPGEGPARWAMVGGTLAELRGIRAGDRVTVWGTASPTEVEVIGLLAAEGVGRANQGHLLVMPLELGQALFHKAGQADAIDVVPVPEISVAALTRAIRARVPPELFVGRPAERSQEVQQILEGLQFMMWFSTALALFSGALIVFNNVTVALRERRRDLSILRALGMNQRRSAALMLAEALVLGLAGSTLGVLLGAVMAQAAVAGLGKTAFAMFDITAGVAAVRPADGVLAVVLGAFCTVGAAYFPVREVYGIHPAEALRAGPEFPAGRSRWRPLLALGLVAGGVAGAAWLAEHGHTVERSAFTLLAGLAVMAAGLGLAGLGPEWLGAGAWPVRILLTACLGFPGRLAVSNLLRSPARSAATASPLVTSIAFMVGFSGFATTYTAFVNGWVDRTMAWDLRVSTGIQGIQARALLPESLAADLGRVEGVALASPQRFVFSEYQEGKVLLSIFVMDHLPRYAALKVVAGLPAPELYAAMAAGEGVAISSVTERLYRLKPGDRMELPTPAGVQRLRVLAVVDSFSPETGEVFLDRRLYQKFWRDRGVDAFVVKVAPGHSADRVGDQIAALNPGHARLEIETPAAFKRRLTGLLQEAFAQVHGLVAVAILVGGLSILNTLTISVLERRREIALFRAVGATRLRVGKTILAEAAGIGIYGASLGGAAGLLLAYGLTRFNREFSGLHLEAHFPAGPLAIGVGVALVLAPLASLLPAWQAAALPPATALRQE